MPWLAALAVLAIAYLLGSIPTGYLAGRLVAGIDVREHGSRSTGATNVLRLLGKGPALAVFAVDVLKGVAAIVVARELLQWLALPEAQAWASWIVCLAGMAALLGHARSVWLGFTGGKSAATGLGVLLALSWPVGLGAAAAFAVVLAALRIVSLASMLGALTAILLVCSLAQPLAYRVLVIAGAAYVVVRHRANIQRLIAGTEPRLGQSTR